MRSIRWAISATALLLSAPLGAAPSVTLVAPAAGVRYVAPAAIELVAEPLVDAGRSIERVEFLADGEVIGVVTQAPWSFSWPNVARGNYNLRARVYDSAGVRDASPAVRVHVRNNTAPRVRVTAPTHRYLSPGSVPLSATVTDRDDPIAKVEFFSGDTLLATSTAEPYEFTWSGVPVGDYEVRARATDALGAVGTSNLFRVRVRDNVAPRVRILGPENNAAYTAPATIPITLRAVDRDDNLANAVLYANGVQLASFESAPFEFSWTNVPAGTYTLTAVATDDYGLTTTSRIVNVSVTGVQPPAQKKLYFIHVDHLNTPRLIQDELQRTVWRWDQTEPFGDSVPDENPSGLGVFEFPMRFPGQYFDKETNVHYNYHRDFDSDLGRFIESDPLGIEVGLNTYAYAWSPLSQVDPLGLMGQGSGANSWRPVPKKPSLRSDGQPWGYGCGNAQTDRLVPDSIGNFDFLPACRAHDVCYETCGANKADCDRQFLPNLTSQCMKQGSYSFCAALSLAFWRAVVTMGGSAYQTAQRASGCPGCP